MFNRFRKNKKGFTLVELIVVVAIIAILGTAVGVAVSGLTTKANKNTAINNASTLATQINAFVNGEGEDTDTLKAYISKKLPTLSVTWSGAAGDKTHDGIASLTASSTATVSKGGWKCVVTIDKEGNASAATDATK